MTEIPNFKTLDIQHIVCDYNGTIAKGGLVLPEIKELFKQLSERYKLHVLTADTFGSVHKQLEGYDVTVKVLNTQNHTKEKANYVAQLEANKCAAIGNGNNDKEMLLSASVAIAVLGDEGCAKDALFNADVICKNIEDALSLFIHTKRLIATLRR